MKKMTGDQLNARTQRNIAIRARTAGRFEDARAAFREAAWFYMRAAESAIGPDRAHLTQMAIQCDVDEEHADNVVQKGGQS